jgi:hypothetical protein
MFIPSWKPFGTGRLSPGFHGLRMDTTIQAGNKGKKGKADHA